MNDKKLGIIIFVRLGSKRLPNKAMIKIKNIYSLEHLYLRVKNIKSNSKIIIATTSNKLDNKIVDFCKSKKITYFRGSNKNVAKRALDCCKKNNLKSFMRVCADRIFFDFNLATKMINFFERKNYEIVTNCLKNTYPGGLGCEIIKLETFKKNYNNLKSLSNKEHIFNYFYKNEKKFRIKNFKSNFSKKISRMNLSLDTKKDLQKIKKCYNELNINSRTPTKKIIKYYKKKNY